MKNEETEEVKTEKPETYQKFSVNAFMSLFEPKFKPEFFSSFEGENYVTVEQDGLPSTYRIGKKSCSDFLILCLREFNLRGGRNKDTITQITDEFDALTLQGKLKKKISIRVGMDKEENVIIDTCNEQGDFIKITHHGYSMTKKPGIPFIKFAKHTPLPLPVQMKPADFLNEWKKLWNFKEQNGSYLALAFLIKALIPKGETPILVLEGIQGSGKSTTCGMIKTLIDPTEPTLLSPPQNEKDLFIMANSCYLIGCDNLSYLSPNMSDLLCRIVSGIGISNRLLWTDADERVSNITRPALFNGIEQLTERPDFLERAVILHTEYLISEKRTAKEEIWDKFNNKMPSLLGGIYETISQVLKYLPTVRKNNLHRMTDFHRVGLALDKVFGLPDNNFTSILDAHNSEKMQNVFHNELFLQAIHQKLMETPEGLIGTAQELMREIFKSRFEKYPAHVIPKTPRQFRGKLDRHKITLEANNIEFGVHQKTAARRETYIRFKKRPCFKETDTDYLDILG